MRLFFIIAALIIGLPGLTTAQVNKIFELGTDEQKYEQITGAYAQSLLEATDNDITRAFESWLDLQQAFEAHALAENYDLKGVKIWLHVFWAADGQIDHIGYLLRPDSRLVDTAEIRGLLGDFAKSYRFPIQNDRPFNHYTGATFPTLSQKRG